jgi:hypothetical protein
MRFLFILLFIISGVFLTLNHVFAQNDSESNNTTLQYTGPAIQLTTNTEDELQTVTIPSSQLLFNLNPHFGNQGNLLNFDITLKPDLADLYKQIDSRQDLKTIFVYPIFTQAAYSKNGFYDYYHGKCDASCLTVSIPQPSGAYSASGDGSVVLHLLGYPFITDVDIDKTPDILKQYDRVIILHNEYVTKKEFNAITSHQDVIFLYPNALLAEVTTDYTNNTITLVRGHGYPEQRIREGFDWQYDNSKYEYNIFCDDWNFYKRDNYTFLNCYPDYRLLYDKELLAELRANDPTELFDDVSNWLRYPYDANVTESILDDYDIQGKYIPNWVQNPSLMLLNQQITRDEFGNMIRYLYEKNIIH